MKSDLIAVQEVVDTLAPFGLLHCGVDVATEDGHVTLTVRLCPEAQGDAAGAFGALELLERLRYVVDVAQVRAFAARYGIPARELDEFLTKGKGGSQE